MLPEKDLFIEEEDEGGILRDDEEVRGDEQEINEEQEEEEILPIRRNNVIHQPNNIQNMTLYQTIEYYILVDYGVDRHLKELDEHEQLVMKLIQQNSKNEKGTQKQLKQVRKLKTFMNQYQSVCNEYLQRIRKHPLCDVNIDSNNRIFKQRKQGSSTEMEGRIDSLHDAFHAKFEPQYLLSFIRKSLLMQAKQNIERDKLYQTGIATTEELLLLYQLKHGNNPLFKLSKEYIHENSDRKLNIFKQEVEDNFQNISK